MDEKKTRVVHFLKEKYDTYIGRANKTWGKHTSMFANPFRLIDHWNDRDMVIELYRVYFYKRLELDPKFKEAVHALKGQVLGCWCKPKACHGDVIVEYLEGIDNNIKKDSNGCYNCGGIFYIVTDTGIFCRRCGQPLYPKECAIKHDPPRSTILSNIAQVPKDSDKPICPGCHSNKDVEPTMDWITKENEWKCFNCDITWPADSTRDSDTEGAQ